MTAKTGTVRFRAEPVDLRLDHDLGLLTLLYHRRSGITHMVSEPVPEILAVLDAIGPSDVAAIARYLSDRFDVQAEGGIETVVAARLEELATLGLVTRERA
jgi:PqqD family protein of HPr-rel-A system